MLVTLFCSLQVAVANEEANIYPAYAIPEGTNISLKQVKEIPPFLYFEGEIQINVEYVYERRSDAYIELTVSPNEESSQRLPYLIRRGIQERATTILIQDSNIDSDQLLSQDQIEAIKSGKQLSYSGEAEIVIYEFGSGFECDKPVSIAKLKRVIIQSRLATVNTKKNDRDC